MRLAKRFFTMNALAVLLSIGLTVLAVILFIAAYTKVVGRETSMHELRRILEVRTGFGELKREALTYDFEHLLDQKVQQSLSDRVKALGSHAVILKNREVLYATQKFNEFDIEKSLMLSGDPSYSDSTVELGGKTYLLARADFKLHSGDAGVLLLLSPVQLKNDFYMLLGLFTIVFFILTFLLLNFWVSYKLTRGIIAPVARLKDAAVKISEGDLSCGIAEEGEGEVRELCRTLELMRIKLKESVYLQQKYDENRKFLVSSISHDLKTPVTSIKGYIEGIIDGVAQTPEKMA